jgi:hypothetical protein
MAKQLIAKQMGNSGSTPGNRVVYQVWGSNEGIRDSDFSFTAAAGTVTMTARKIESVINCGTSPVTIDGKLFETGNWQMSQIGGVNLSVTDNEFEIVFTTPAAGNVIIEFRS